MSDLVQAGWIAPAPHGLERRSLAAIAVLAIVSFGAWAVLAWGWPLDRLRHDDVSTLRMTISPTGTATVEEEGASDPPSKLVPGPVQRQVRTLGRADFLVLESVVRRGDSRTLRVRVDGATGVDLAAVNLRVYAVDSRVRRRSKDGRLRDVTVEGRSTADVRIVATIPLRRLPRAAVGESAGRMRAFTKPLDAKIADASRHRRLFDRITRLRWWLTAIGLLPTILVVGSAVRSGRRFHSMREPGSGTTPSSSPPSGLDPVGAAGLVAGAEAIDLGDAFAGYLLDLVERRQLRLRRVVDPVFGPGCLLGLAQVDDDPRRPAKPSDPADAAVALVRSCAMGDGLTVALPDARSFWPRSTSGDRRAWREHVAARMRFERIVDRAPLRRLHIAGAVVGSMLVIAGVAAVVTPAGPDTAWMLVAASLAPCALALALWERSARRWRRVARTRQLERAQWCGWGAALADGEVGVGDVRHIPSIVAVGGGFLLPAYPPAGAVGLDAVSSATVDVLASLTRP